MKNIAKTLIFVACLAVSLTSYGFNAWDPPVHQDLTRDAAKALLWGEDVQRLLVAASISPDRNEGGLIPTPYYEASHHCDRLSGKENHQQAFINCMHYLQQRFHAGLALAQVHQVDKAIICRMPT